MKPVDSAVFLRRLGYSRAEVVDSVEQRWPHLDADDLVARADQKIAELDARDQAALDREAIEQEWSD